MANTVAATLSPVISGAEVNSNNTVCRLRVDFRELGRFPHDRRQVVRHKRRIRVAELAHRRPHCRSAMTPLTWNSGRLPIARPREFFDGTPRAPGLGPRKPCPYCPVDDGFPNMFVSPRMFTKVVWGYYSTNSREFA